jgi:hypothetical protein
LDGPDGGFPIAGKPGCFGAEFRKTDKVVQEIAAAGFGRQAGKAVLVRRILKRSNQGDRVIRQGMGKPRLKRNERDTPHGPGPGKIPFKEDSFGVTDRHASHFIVY